MAAMKKFKFRKQPDVLSLNPKKQKQVKKQMEQITREEGKNEVDKLGRGIVFIFRLPFGFFEPQLKKYFEQFGTVTRVKVCRSRKTGRSKGYGFIEFESLISAKVAAETMDNYMAFGKIIRCRLVVDKVPPDLFKNYKWRMNPIKRRFLKSLKNLNKPHTYNDSKNLSLDMQITLDKKIAQLRELGIEYSLKITHDDDFEDEEDGDSSSEDEEPSNRNDVSIEELQASEADEDEEEDEGAANTSYFVEEYCSDDDNVETTIEASEVTTEMSTCEIEDEIVENTSVKQKKQFIKTSKGLTGGKPSQKKTLKKIINQTTNTIQTQKFDKKRENGNNFKNSQSFNKKKKKFKSSAREFSANIIKPGFPLDSFQQTSQQKPMLSNAFPKKKHLAQLSGNFSQSGKRKFNDDSSPPFKKMKKNKNVMGYNAEYPVKKKFIIKKKRYQD